MSWLTFGNDKLPSSTAIFNMGPAKTCPSRKLGLCQAYVDGKCVCYARGPEMRFPKTVLPHRQRQGRYWLSTTADNFLRRFDKARRRTTTALRFNESGDFWGQGCVDKAETIARELAKDGITTYLYSARSDLSYRKVRNLVVNTSGGWKKSGTRGKFIMIPKGQSAPMGAVFCPGSCKSCTRCQHGLTTYAAQHGNVSE